MAAAHRRALLTTMAIIALVGATLAQTSRTVFAADAPLTLVRGDVGVTIPEGGSLPSGTIYGVFNDPDRCSGSGDFTLNADLGDGTPTIPDLEGYGFQTVLDPGGGCNWDIVEAPGWSNYYAEENTYHLVFTVQDTGGNMLSIAATATVNDAPLTSSSSAVASQTEGGSFTVTLGAFTDASGTSARPTGCENEGLYDLKTQSYDISNEPDTTHYLATVSWGDGSETLGTVTRQAGTCTFLVGGSHTYAEEGTYPVHVTVQDEGGSQTAFDTSITAGDAPLSIITTNPDTSPINYNLAGVEGQPLTTTDGQANPAVAVFHDSNSNCDVNDFSAYVIWNDGSNPDKAIIRQRYNTLPGDCQFTVLDPHTVADARPTTPYSVRIYDQGVEVDQTAGTYTVSDAPLTSVQAGTTVLNSNDSNSRELLGTFRDAGCGAGSEFSPSAVSFGDSNADNHSTSEVSIALSTDGNPCDWDVFGSHVYTGPGTYSTSVTVQDSDGASVSITGTSNVDVNDAPLTLVRGDIGESIPEGGSLASGTIYGVFHDPDQCGGLGDFTLTADLGDGTPTQPDIVSTPNIIHAVPDAGGSCNWDIELDPNWFNIYIEEGTYHVVWTVKDTGGNLLSIPSTIEVTDAPLTSSGTALPTLYEGSTFSGQLGTFTDANSNGF